MLWAAISDDLSDNDFDVLQDVVRTKFFLSSTKKEGPFMCEGSRNALFPLCRDEVVTEVDVQQPQSVRLMPEYGEVPICCKSSLASF